MPTKRVPISRFSTALNVAQLAFLNDTPLPDGADPVIWLEHCWLTASHRSLDDMPARSRPSARQLWEQYGEAVMAEWVEAHPGERPPAWWKVAAPELRRRLGGIGEPRNTETWHGVPSYWWGQTKSDPHGKKHLIFDLDDPPVYESEAAFLARHGLLSGYERKHLTPDDFAPEPITELFKFGDL